jgi:S1-C subfamily serine protease
MKLEEAAFVALVGFAREDGVITQSERSLLDRYRETLGVPEEFAEKVLQGEDVPALDPEKIKGLPSDRVHILKMMIRVACADGVISRGERRLLKRVARSMGIGGLALRGLFWEIEQEQGVRKRLRRSQIVAAATVVAAAVAVFLVFKHYSGVTEHRFDETLIDLETLKDELGLERAQAEDALRLVRDSQKDLVQRETDLEKRLEELGKKTVDERNALKTALTTEQKNQRAAMQAEIERLRGELARVRSLNTIFKSIEREYGASILLIFIAYDLVKDQDRITRGSMGTGFFVSSSGHAVTNKHVVQPWKFGGDEIMLMDNGFSIDKASMVMAAWPAGAEVKTPQGDLNLDAAYTIAKNDLELSKTAPDTFEYRTERLEMGIPYRGRFHTIDNGDLAVIKVTVPSPVKAFPLETAAEKLEKLDPVMVLGFPVGINILETTRAETSPSLGEVRKIEKSIMVTAPIVPGNSGGPLIDARGSVVGVASKIFGEATLGSCIPARYILPLLPNTHDLLEDVAAYEAAGSYRAALDDLRLAEQRCENDKEREMVGGVRDRLLAVRDGMTAKARQEEEAAAKRDALQDVVERFGPHWAREAAELLKKM